MGTLAFELGKIKEIKIFGIKILEAMCRLTWEKNLYIVVGGTGLRTRDVISRIWPQNLSYFQRLSFVF